jgi:hypothetical protein
VLVVGLEVRAAVGTQRLPRQAAAVPRIDVGDVGDVGDVRHVGEVDDFRDVGEVRDVGDVGDTLAFVHGAVLPRLRRAAPLLAGHGAPEEQDAGPRPASLDFHGREFP